MNDEVIYSPSGKVLISCPKEIQEYAVPEGVTQIKAEAFADCTALRKITLPESVKTIGVRAFTSCTALKRIKLPSGMKKICAGTFWRCTALEEVILPDKLKRIGSGAFIRCNSLQHIAIPSSVCMIDSYAFEHCKNLQEIQYQGITIHMNFMSWDEMVYFRRVIDFIRNRNLEDKIIASVKYDILWQMFFQSPDDEKLKDYLKRYFSKIFIALIEKDDAGSVQKIIDTGEFITSKNIDKFIRYAIDHQKIQCQILLMNHKKAQYGYENQKNLFL